MPPALALGVRKCFKGTRGSRTNHLMFGHQPLLKGCCLKRGTISKVSYLDMAEVSSEVVEPYLFIYAMDSISIHSWGEASKSKCLTK